jgi:4-hydroxy-4-methyl-2-oxoglutarate aldolase
MSLSQFGQTRPEPAIGAETWEKILKVAPAPVSDLLHARGLHHQVMRHEIQPLQPTMRLAGIAHTMLSRPLVGKPVAGKEYELLLATLDSLQPGEVLVTDEMNCCAWGELCAEVAGKNGANGVVIDGFTRDVEDLRKLDFPVYCRGHHMSDMLYHRTITGMNEPVLCGGVSVSPGDLLLGSEDGVVVVPAALIDEVIQGAYAMTETECSVRVALREGMSASAAYKKFGAL